MSKIGRKPINTKDVQIEVKGQAIHYKGKKASGLYELPPELSAHYSDSKLSLKSNKPVAETARIWGLHRALLANKIKGATEGFEQKIIITGLGFKAVVSGKKLILSLGFSHKIDFELPEGITIDVDKTGQILTVKGSDKELVGQVCSKICSQRPPEPYKGTGVKLEHKVLIRKAGKTKAAAA